MTGNSLKCNQWNIFMIWEKSEIHLHMARHAKSARENTGVCVFLSFFFFFNFLLRLWRDKGVLATTERWIAEKYLVKYWRWHQTMEDKGEEGENKKKKHQNKLYHVTNSFFVRFFDFGGGGAVVVIFVVC